MSEGPLSGIKVLEFETPQIFVEIFDIIYSIDEIIF